MNPTSQRWLAGGVIGCAAALVWVVGVSRGQPPQPATPGLREAAPRGPLDSDEQHTIGVFERVAPSVVYINTRQTVRRQFGFFMGTDVVEGTGSGFIWDEQGHIITNYHVAGEAADSEVVLSDGSVWPAKPIGGSADQDVFILKIEAPAEKLRPIPLGTSADLRVGQRVLAIGNPFGLDQTLTTGVISALGRSIPTVSGKQLSGVVQTDAAINPGNSGGPLLDSAGRLIGVNTAIRSPSGASAGIGFAVPVDIVNEVISDLLTAGPPRASMGFVRADPGRERAFGLTRGVMIGEIQPGTGADEAGLRGLRIVQDRYRRYQIPGDIIVAVEDTPINNFLDLRRLLRSYNPGDIVAVTVVRDGEEARVPVRLGGRPAE